MKPSEIAKTIDHAILKPDGTTEDLVKGCMTAAKYKVASVCVKPYMVRDAIILLKDADVKVGTVIGFPHGAIGTRNKIEEIAEAYWAGAKDVDVVINIGKVMEKDWDYIKNEILEISMYCPNTMILKIIFETGIIKDEESIKKLCEICSQFQVDFVKTSTGYGYVRDFSGIEVSTGATTEAVGWMRKYSDPKVGIKASGGIKTLDQALIFIDLGCTRIGTSATETIMEEAIQRYGKY